MFPDRIDLGLGRAPGTDQRTLQALRRGPESSEYFPQDAVELQNLLGPPQEDQSIHAIPGEDTSVPLWILGSSLYGAQLAAMVDLNDDGRLDLIVTNRFKPAILWRNLGKDDHHWLKVSLEQPGGNRTAVGAWVEVRTPTGVQRRERTVGGGHAGGQWGPLHFGLGAAQTVEVRAQWPGGTWSSWKTVKADRTAVLAR